jgi:hypothetical protein
VPVGASRATSPGANKTSGCVADLQLADQLRAKLGDGGSFGVSESCACGSDGNSSVTLIMHGESGAVTGSVVIVPIGPCCGMPTRSVGARYRVS